MGVYHFYDFTPTFWLFARPVGIALHIYIHTSHAFMVTLMHGTHTYTHIFFPCVNVPMQIGIHTYICLSDKHDSYLGIYYTCIHLHIQHDTYHGTYFICIHINQTLCIPLFMGIRAFSLQTCRNTR